VELFGRGAYRFGGRKPTGGATKRARPVPGRSPRPSLEELESRVLLFGGQFEQSLPFHAGDPPVQPAAIALVAPPLALDLEAIAIGGLNEPTGEAAPVALPGIGSPPLAQINPVHVFFVGQHDFGGLASAGSLDPGEASSSSVQGAHPMIVSMGSGTATNGTGEFALSASTSFYGPIPLARSFVGIWDPGAETAGSSVPYPREGEFAGAVGAVHPLISLPAPAGSMTGSVELFFQPAEVAGPGLVPFFGRLAFLNSEGGALFQVSPDSEQGQPTVQLLNAVLHEASVDGHQLAQVASPPGASSAGPGVTSTASPTPNSSASFVVDVQRQEESGQQGGSPPAQAPVAFATLLAPSSWQAGLPLAFQQTAALADTSAGAGQGGQEILIDSTNATADGAGPADGFNVRVPIGPLASRSAGPLGPVVADWEIDLAPPVDRHERGLFQELDGLGADDEADLGGWRSQLASAARPAGLDEDSPASDIERSSGSVIALTGGGGFPLKVTGLVGGQRAEAAALLASIPTSSTERAASRPAEQRGTTDVVPDTLAAQAGGAGDQSDWPDLLRAACGLALGVGLTSGPLFSDLLASVHSRLPKWLRRRRRERRAERAPGVK
jgi:hypothetical protein